MKVQTSLGEVRVKWVRNWRGCVVPPRRFITSCYVLMPTGERFIGTAVKHPKDRYHAGIAQYWALRRALEAMAKSLREMGEDRIEAGRAILRIGCDFWAYAEKPWGRNFSDSPGFSTFSSLFCEVWPREEEEIGETPPVAPPSDSFAGQPLRDDQRELLKAWEVLKEGAKLPLAQDVRVELYSDGSGEVLPAHSRAVIGRHFNIAAGKSPVIAIRTERDSLRGRQ